ncbi:MAG TPA: ADP-forming succinate--CoA ligase subunit beta [Thiothrix sp.]|nr:ADP-forming succinate--CoA ligase subunit beta [Thiothrix sp.]
MNLHEYQAKTVFAQYAIPVPRGQLVTNVEQLPDVITALGEDAWVVKAQAHTGGRGKVGGVKLVRGEQALYDATNSLLGSTLVTQQTGSKGLPVDQVWVESLTDIARELYVSVLVDRATQRLVIIASAAGGMDIEQVAADTPEKILTEMISPITGYQAYIGRKLAFGLGLSGKQVRQFDKLLANLVRVFTENDAALIEINPLVVQSDGELMALDGKINLDSNALYRHPQLKALRDIRQEDVREAQAAEHQLNYIHLDGTIGCMVNGAGLAMATMDLIKLHGGEPANFLDVGGGTTAERVAEAFKIILSDNTVEAVLVNIFGGIVRCDLIAEGIIQAIKEIDVAVPVIVRLEGTNVEQGKTLLAESNMNIMTADGLTDAAQQAVAAAQTYAKTHLTTTTQTTGDAA